MALSKGFKVLEKSAPPSPYSVLVQRRGADGSLLLESSAAVALSAAETEAVRRSYAKVADAYGCLGVLQLNAGESCLLYLVLITGCCSVGKIGDVEVFRITQTQFIPLFYRTAGEDRAADVRKLLNSGTFYFSSSHTVSNTAAPFDLTLCSQRRSRTSESDNRFFWNRMLFVHLLRFGINCDEWLTRAVCGSVEIRTVYVGAKQARAVLVSRLSCERAGTRFNVRGCNDDGHVANFVETEQALYMDDNITSYVQTRGSVPLFWEQPGIQVGSHKVKMSRGFHASSAAFDRHFSQMKRNYNTVTVVNLLGSSLLGGSEGEAALSNAFQKHLAESRHYDVTHIIFDYHQEIRAGVGNALSKFRGTIESLFEDIGIFSSRGTDIYNLQKGVIRTNCLDCLDRTNCIQTFIGIEMLNYQLILLQISDKKQNITRFEEVFRQMWINNGNEISKIYAGTGAIQGGSKLIDGARSAARTIQNNLLDNSKQEAIDILLLGSTLNSELADRARILLPPKVLHASTPVLRELCRRHSQYTQPDTVRITIGTYNVNGGKHFRSVAYKDVSLADWLLDSPNSALVNTTGGDRPSDFYAVGFQEIVDLNASNIMAASSENARAWGEELERVLCRDVSYTLLSSQQLVGVCLFVFVRTELVPHVRDVALDSVKTGLGGATGNKGAAAIRLVIYGTSLCFVCAHFAAGQSQVSERNADYAEITRKVAFPMGRSLNSHDYVFWCGDFNYRVDLDKDEIRSLVQQNNLSRILEQDQLTKQKEEGLVFKNCFEGEITFPPTYKYDLFSDDYDTSEKCRAPAWTDRVLWRSRKQSVEPEATSELGGGRLIHYSRAELKQSDHRPVIAVLEAEVLQVSNARCMEVFYEVVKDLGPPDGSIVLTPREGDDSALDDAVMAAALQELSTIGEVTLVRFIDDNSLCVTFREGQNALSALGRGEIIACSIPLTISLKSPDWMRMVRAEIELCSSNTMPLFGDCGSEPPARSAPSTPRRQPARPPAPDPTPLVPSRAPPASPARPPPPRPAPPPPTAASNSTPSSAVTSPVVAPQTEMSVPPACAPPPPPPATPPPAPPPVPARQGAPPPLPARPTPRV